jgi:hypothetical protein
MHSLVLFLGGLFLGVILGYAFRGKEHEALADAGAKVASVEGDVKKHL